MTSWPRICVCLLMVLFWTISFEPAIAREMRVLSETIVGDPPAPNEQTASDTEYQPVQERSELPQRKQQPDEFDAIDLSPTSYQFSTGISSSQIFTDPQNARVGTSLKSDPVSGSFGLSGSEKSIEVKRVDNKTGLYLGVEASKGSFNGSVSLKQGLDTPRDSSLDSTVDLDVTSVGLNFGRMIHDEGSKSAVGSVTFGFTRHEYDLLVRDRVNAYIGGFAFPSSDVETTSGNFVSTDLGISHTILVDDGFRLGVTQRYRVPISGDETRYRQFSTQVGISKDFGPGTKEQSRQLDTPSPGRCHAIEILGGDGFAVISGTETSSSAKRSIDVQNEIGWSASHLGARLRFGKNDKGCHELGGVQSDRTISYRVRGLDVNSSIDVPLSGYELRYNFQPRLIKSENSQTYVSIGSGLWIGDGESSTTSSFTFDNVSSTNTEKTELVLLDLGVGLGSRQFLSERQYLFYELSTSRYDGRPLEKDVYGWENNIRAGAGLNF